ncbi:MAG: glutamate synthase-related protein [Pseudomonadota bacterium]
MKEKWVEVVDWKSLKDRAPSYALVAGVDLVVVRYDDEVSVLYGRCLHRGALLADGRIEGENLICSLHNWDYRYDTGISAYNNDEALHKFGAVVKKGKVFVNETEIAAWAEDHPQPFDRDAYQGLYADTHPEAEEPFVGQIQELAKNGLKNVGHHGAVSAMGVSREDLPKWSDIQIVTAQLHRVPLLDEEFVGTDTVIGKRAKKPLKLEIPLFVSDMSFGALSREAKIALAKGAEMAGTGICSGEGGSLDDERHANSRYFYELASAKFGFSWEKVREAKAFHFKGGQGAKTGTGGHLPGAKVTEEIADVRGLKPGQDAISPSRFPEWTSPEHFKECAAQVRAETGGVPVGFKLSAQNIEKDIDAALEIGCDYIILDGRGGGTGAAPLIFRDNISVPTIPALARARRHLDRTQPDVTLVITGGLRLPEDFVKALALGADAIAVSNAAMQAIGCLGMRACHTNRCPVGIATMDPHFRARLEIEKGAKQLATYFEAAVHLMQVLARACGRRHVSEFQLEDLTTFKREMAELAGVPFGGVGG